MANALYSLGKQAIVDDSVDLIADTIKICGVTSGYSPNLSADEFLSDVPSGDIVCTSSALTSKTTTNGVFKAANVTFSSVTGSAIAYIVMYKDTGSSATSRLILVLDTATGLPVTPTGGAITVTWNASGIFAL